jgi:hypothetical protein
MFSQRDCKDACDIVWPEIPRKSGQKIFVKTDDLRDYLCLSSAFPPHILVTGLSDHSPTLCLRKNHGFVDRSNIIAWYAQHLCFQHPKVKHLPVGLLDNPEQLAFYATYGEQLRAVPKQDAVYSNFNVETNPKERGAFINEVHARVSFEEYMWAMARYKYVMCPMGNGIDTHRVYEAHLCGCIPIVRCPKEFLPTYAHMEYISLPGYCYVKFDEDKNIYERYESIFKHNTPDSSVLPTVVPAVVDPVEEEPVRELDMSSFSAMFQSFTRQGVESLRDFSP